MLRPLGAQGGAVLIMHGTASDAVSWRPSSPSPCLPLTFEPMPDGRIGRVLLLALVAAGLAALIAPIFMIATHLAADPSARALITDQPRLAVLPALGLAVMLIILGWPLVRLIRSLPTRRRITIHDGVLHTEEIGFFGTRQWSEPLGAYAGLGHRMRSSLSGVRQELVLVHRQPSRSVVLETGPRITPESVNAKARLLGLAEIPSREASRVVAMHEFFGLAKRPPQLPEAIRQ